MTRSVPLWGLVLDATKCFDSLSVKGIGYAARNLGLPGELIGALERWYDVHRRHVVVHSWAQPPFSPARGVLQGCPLSVCFCSIWGMLWAHKAAQHLAAVPPQIGHLTVYLDDLNMLSSQKPALETAMGYTQVFLDFWKVDLNTAKSRLLANEAAQQHDLPNAIVRDLDNRQGLLGAPAGMLVEEAMLQKRVSQAQIRLDRLALLPVSQGALRKLVLCFVSSVPYGLEMVPYSAQMRSLDRKVKNLTWGRARCSSNAHVLRSLVFHPCLLMETRRICSCFRAVWLLANRESERATFMELWTVDFIPRHQGKGCGLSSSPFWPDGGLSCKLMGEWKFHGKQ